MARTSTEQRKAEIVDAAVRVIAAHGVAGATTRRIAEEANTSLATLHYCFTHKRDLFIEVMRRVSEQMATTTPIPDSNDLTSAATEYLRSAVEWMLAHEDYALAQMDLGTWLVRHDQDLAAQSYMMFVNRLTDILGAVDSDGDSDLMSEIAGQVFVAVDGLMVQWFALRDQALLVSQLELQCNSLAAFLNERATA